MALIHPEPQQEATKEPPEMSAWRDIEAPPAPPTVGVAQAPDEPENASSAQRYRLALKQWFTEDGFTGHGIPRIPAENMKIGMIWTVLVIVAFVFIVQGTWSTLSDALIYRPVVTSLSITPSSTAPFPAVTVCPTFMFKPSYSPSDLLDGSYMEKACNATEFILDFGYGTADAETNSFLNMLSDNHDKHWSSHAEQITSHWQITLVPTTIAFGGPCATFNADGSAGAAFQGMGLSLTLGAMVHCNTTFRGTRPMRQGFSVVLHEPGTIISEADIITEGISIDPGKETLLRYHTRMRNQTSQPTGIDGHRCKAEPSSYSDSDCRFQSKIDMELDACGCANPPPHDKLEKSCYATEKSSDVKCVEDKVQEINKASFDSCEDACNSVTYPYISSSSAFPAEAIAEEAWEYMSTHPIWEAMDWNAQEVDPATASSFSAKAMRRQILQQTLASVWIGPRSTSLENVAISLKYPDVFSVISSIGGTWSFWLGFSVVTFAELFLAPFVAASRLRTPDKDL